MKVGSNGKSEADERHEGGDGVHDKNGRQRMSLGRGQREVGVGRISEQIL